MFKIIIQKGWKRKQLKNEHQKARTSAKNNAKYNTKLKNWKPSNIEADGADQYDSNEDDFSDVDDVIDLGQHLGQAQVTSREETGL